MPNSLNRFSIGYNLISMPSIILKVNMEMLYVIKNQCEPRFFFYRNPFPGNHPSERLRQGEMKSCSFLSFAYENSQQWL